MNVSPKEETGSILIRTRTGYGIFPLGDVLITVLSDTPTASPSPFWVKFAIFRATGKVTFSIAISSSPIGFWLSVTV